MITLSLRMRVTMAYGVLKTFPRRGGTSNKVQQQSLNHFLS